MNKESNVHNNIWIDYNWILHLVYVPTSSIFALAFGLLYSDDNITGPRCNPTSPALTAILLPSSEKKTKETDTVCPKNSQAIRLPVFQHQTLINSSSELETSLISSAENGTQFTLSGLSLDNFWTKSHIVYIPNFNGGVFWSRNCFVIWQKYHIETSLVWSWPSNDLTIQPYLHVLSD